MNSSELIPGDIIEVPENLSLPCDLILLSGSAIVNEAMLTGESIPVMKSNLPKLSQEIYTPTATAKHTLFGGTSIIQTRQIGDEKVYGLVSSTGFLTTKGALVRDILYPKEIKFKFYQDGMKFVFIMACIAVCGFAVTLPLQMGEDILTSTLIDRSLDLITITVPPAIPAAMTCGVVFALQRLKRQKIFCISPERVNVAGRVTKFVFDKTGTLTEEGLSVLGFRAATEPTITTDESATSFRS